MLKSKNKAGGENAFTAANLQATKAHSPPPSPILRLQDLEELILAMTDKIQASKTLGENSFGDTDFK